MVCSSGRRCRPRPNAPPDLTIPITLQPRKSRPSTLVPSVRKWYQPAAPITNSTTGGKTSSSNYARKPLPTLQRRLLRGIALLRHLRLVYQPRLASVQLDRGLSHGQRQQHLQKPRASVRGLATSSFHPATPGSSTPPLMVGDGIRTTLTPLTFSKPRFDGVQWDMMSDKIRPDPAHFAHQQYRRRRRRRWRGRREVHHIHQLMGRQRPRSASATFPISA